MEARTHKEKLIMEARTQKGSEHLHRAEKEHHQRSYSSERNNHKRSELYPPGFVHGDCFEGSQFYPSHSPQTGNKRSHLDQPKFSERAGNEKSEFYYTHPSDCKHSEMPLLSHSVSVQKKHCGNPRPRFVPNLPPRPRQRGAISRTVPERPRNKSCIDDRSQSNKNSSLVSANQRNMSRTDQRAEKISREKNTLFMEDQDSLIFPEHTLLTSTEYTFSKSIEAKTQQTGTTLPCNLPINTTNGEILQASQDEELLQIPKAVENRIDKIASTQQRFQVPLENARLFESTVAPGEDALLNFAPDSNCTDTSIPDVKPEKVFPSIYNKEQTMQNQVSHEELFIQSSELAPEGRREKRDSSLLSISQKEQISSANVRRPSEMKNMSAYMAKQPPKTWIRNGSQETFRKFTTLPNTQEQFYRPRQRGAVHGQLGKSQDFQIAEGPCHLRYPYESQQFQVLSALQYSKREFLGICSELERAMEADERMYHQMHKELDISFFEVRSAKEAVLKEKRDMESIKKRVLEDPLAMSRQITTMKEARGDLEDINTDLSVQLAELNQLQEQLEEQQRILEVLMKLKPDKHSCNDDEDEFLLTKQEECKAKLSTIESELTESRKTTNKLEQISLKRLEDLKEVNVQTGEGMEARIRETRPLKGATSLEEQIIPMKQPKLESES